MPPICVSVIRNTPTMSLFDIFKSSNEPEIEDKTLVVIDWDKVRKNVEDLSFVTEYKQPKVWVFVRQWANENLVDKLVNEQPFDIKEQPEREKYLAHYLIANVIHEVFSEPGYTKVVFICGDESYLGTADFIRDHDIETDLKIFDRRQRVSDEKARDRGGRGKNDRGGRNERSRGGKQHDDRRDDKRGGKSRRSDRSSDSRNDKRGDKRSDRRGDKRSDKKRGGGKRKSSRPAMEHTPNEYANMIYNRIKKDLELEKSYTNSRLAQMVKSTTGHAISNLIGNRGNRMLLDALSEAKQLEVIDTQHFKLLELPDKQIIADLIAKRHGKGGSQKGGDNKHKEDHKEKQQENQPA